MVACDCSCGSGGSADAAGICWPSSEGRSARGFNRGRSGASGVAALAPTVLSSSENKIGIKSNFKFYLLKPLLQGGGKERKKKKERKRKGEVFQKISPPICGHSSSHPSIHYPLFDFCCCCWLGVALLPKALPPPGGW